MCTVVFVSTILTKYIKPPQLFPNQPYQRNTILLDHDRIGDTYQFCYHHDNESRDEDVNILSGPCCFVKIEQEGESSLLFAGKFKELNIPRTKSKAKEMLYKDIMKGVVPTELKYSNKTSTMELK